MQKVLILDLGGQCDLLIARRVRECHVFCEIHPAAMPLDKIRAFEPKGIILSGTPGGIGQIDPQIFQLGVPVLGIGLGCQTMIAALGGAVEPCSPIHGRTLTNLSEDAVLFAEMPPMTISWMDIDAQITALPDGFVATASTNNCPIAAFSCPERQLYGTQFRPESPHTEGGMGMLDRFLKSICGCVGDWRMENVVNDAVADIRRRVGDRRVLLALSGGVDSSVAAAVLSRAVGSRLTCIFVDHGMLRMDEGDQVEAYFSRMDVHFVRVNARERFQSALENVTDPTEKRRIIGEEFVKVFEDQAKKLGSIDFLAQGTIYPDILETGPGYADVIRSSREMGRLPGHIDFKELIEPLRLLFKEEVRELGRTMGLPAYLVDRQPFPGPGLAIRMMGNITPEKIRLLQAADHIVTQELEGSHLNRSIGQYFAVLTDTMTMGGYIVALRVVTTEDYLTAKWARLPYELLDKISTRLMTEVPGISRVTLDITNKPPASIEWE
ncbi:MAG: glutamine-hydrolyzing GMP synthase [Oscillospiraceae bacterium]|nr:glutamine-hydrolyzing GMP synthase [Oscillospiraceae bacterium]